MHVFSKEKNSKLVYYILARGTEIAKVKGSCNLNHITSRDLGNYTWSNCVMQLVKGARNSNTLLNYPNVIEKVRVVASGGNLDRIVSKDLVNDLLHFLVHSNLLNLDYVKLDNIPLPIIIHPILLKLSNFFKIFL